MYYHVYVTGTKLNIQRDNSHSRAFTGEMLYRLQISILIPPILLFLMAMVTYMNDSFNRKKKSKKHLGRIFATGWFAIAFYCVFAKNRFFCQTFEKAYNVSRSDYEI